MRRLAFVLALAPLLLVAACERPAEPPVEVGVLPPEMQEELRRMRADLNATLAEADMAIESLEAEAEAVDEERRADMEVTLATLRHQRDALQRELGELEAATADAFAERRTEIRQQLDALESDLTDARERFLAEHENSAEHEDPSF